MWAKDAKRLFEAWYRMYVKPWHPELVMVGCMYPLKQKSTCMVGCMYSQVISASSGEQHW